MRPASIIRFERLYLAALAVSLLADALGWSSVVASARAQPGVGDAGPIVVIGGLAIAYALMLILWYFAARRHSVVAKWLIAAWFVISTALLALALFRYPIAFKPAAILGWGAYLLRAWSVSYLFKPDADEWFASRR